MTKKRKITVVFAAVLVGLIAIMVWRLEPKSTPQPPEAINRQQSENRPPAVHAVPKSTPPRDPAKVRFAEALPNGISLLPESREMVAELNQKTESPEHDLEVVENLLTTYRGIFGSNPPGGLNSEIVAAMLGANPRKLAILPRDMAALSPSGELLDRWGTPFLFHPVSNEVMEVMSAGPDQALWTADDVGKITPTDEAMGL